jgi:hypothetical protein
VGGGSAKPKRRKASGAALRYEHRRGRGPVPEPKKRDFSCLFACLVLLGFLALIAPLVVIDQVWGREIWSDLAPDWPGGAYVFAACVGVLVPVAFGLFVTPLVFLNWKEHPLRSLALLAGALPGLALGWLVAAVIFAYTRPKRRGDWDAACYSRGGPCWAHQEYPYLWAVGLLSTLAVVALLIGWFALYVRRNGGKSPAAAETAEPAGPAEPAR